MPASLLTGVNGCLTTLSASVFSSGHGIPQRSARRRAVLYAHDGCLERRSERAFGAAMLFADQP
jgi:hypothetical protein